MASQHTVWPAPSIAGASFVAKSGRARVRHLGMTAAALLTVRLGAKLVRAAVRASSSPTQLAAHLRQLALSARPLHGVVNTLPRRNWFRQKFAVTSGRYFWDLYAPGFPSAAFDHYVDRELRGLSDARLPTPLNTAIVAVTTRCALKCEHCLEWDALNPAEALSSAQLHQIVGRIAARGVGQIFLTGGEPLHRLADVLSLAATVSAKADVWLLTSGLGLTADKARRLRTAGVTGLALSLDHWDSQAHDRFRGFPGSFDAVERAADLARDAGLVVAVSLCPTRTFVTRDNLERYAITAREFGASFIQILEPKATGRYAHQDVALEPIQQRMLEEFCLRLNLDPAARDLPSVAYVDWSTRAIGCAGGERYLYVDTHGTLHACPFCRAPGSGALDDDFDAALSSLREAGCPSAARSRTGHDHCSPRTSP